jgi:hypothetical protein
VSVSDEVWQNSLVGSESLDDLASGTCLTRQGREYLAPRGQNFPARGANPGFRAAHDPPSPEGASPGANGDAPTGLGD